MKHKDLRSWLSVIVGGESLVSHAGATLLVETARRSGLARQLSGQPGPWRLPGATHHPGKVVLDLAIAAALGGAAACDIAVLRAQPGVFGRVASDLTVSRLIVRLAEDPDAALEAITTARAVARERMWNWAGAPVQDGQVVIDLDATLVAAHSEKQDATRTWKKTFGFHPLLGRGPRRDARRPRQRGASPDASSARWAGRGCPRPGPCSAPTAACPSSCRVASLASVWTRRARWCRADHGVGGGGAGPAPAGSWRAAADRESSDVHESSIVDGDDRRWLMSASSSVTGTPRSRSRSVARAA